MKFTVGYQEDDRWIEAIVANCASVYECEHLDGAKFVGEKGEGPDRKDTLRCFAFTTPRGSLAVLFDRNEGGMLLNLKKKKMPRGTKGDGLFRHNDPWVRHWSVAKDYSFKVADAVRVFDLIGRERPAQVKDGQLHLALDGEPVFVYGLDLDILVKPVGADVPGGPTGREPTETEYAAEEHSGTSY